MAAKVDNNFRKPEPGEVEGWYKWALSLDNTKNPFAPADAGANWEYENDNNNIIWLAGITATTRPAYKPNNASNLDAVVKGSEARVVYNDGMGKPVNKNQLPQIKMREIILKKGDERDLYVPPTTELATSTKYPKLADRLDELAQKIVDREDAPAFIRFQPANDPLEFLDTNRLKTEFRINGALSLAPHPDDNVFMLPPHEPGARAAFSENAAILKGGALKPGKNILEFGVEEIKGSIHEFSYTVAYNIIK
jgi:hypothetical protein